MIRSATVDSSLFSRYFGHCPVVTAEGRTHPVTTYFLEDIYDQINYRLASDSPASLTNETVPSRQVLYGHLNITLAELSYNLSDLWPLTIPSS